MRFVVLPALVPDIERIYDIYFAAFDNDPMGRIISQILFPAGITPEFRKAHTASTLEWWKHCEWQYTLKSVDVETGEIVGMVLGDLFPKGRTQEQRINHGVSWLEGQEKERADRILNPLWEAREKVMGGQPHIYIHVFAVDPKHQGRSAGLSIMRWGIGLAEKTGLPIYFEASPTTVGMYRKAGIKTLKEEVVHRAADLGTETDITVPLMIYEPSSGTPMDTRLFRDPYGPLKRRRVLSLRTLLFLFRRIFSWLRFW